MTKLIALIFSYIILCQRLLSPGGIRAVAAENMALRQQLITLSRSQKRTTRLTFFEKNYLWSARFNDYGKSIVKAYLNY
jgi:hypothetical protein